MAADWVVENIDADDSADGLVERAANVIEGFGLRTPLRDVLALYEYALRHRVENPV